MWIIHSSDSPIDKDKLTLLFEEDFEEPIDVFYHCWSKLADHMLADPDLNMYLCIRNYPFVETARLRDISGLIPRWYGYFPTEKQEMFMRAARRGDIGVFMFDKTARYPNALYQAMGGKIWVGDSIVVTNDPDFPTNVMDAMIRRSQCLPADSGDEQPYMLGSKSFKLSFEHSDLPGMVHGHILANNEIMWNIFHGME